MHELNRDIADVASIKAIPTILDIVCRTTGMRFAAVTRVTEDRWIVGGVRDEIEFGLLPGDELRADSTLCQEVRASGQAVIIENVAEDEIFRHHPAPAIFGLQSYIAMPIRLPDGTFFGTLCALDPAPRRLNTPETIAMLEMFAEVIGSQLSDVRRANRAEASLVDERAEAALREQFIAVLGHDLRNPLAAIGAGVRALHREPQSEKATRVLRLVEGSVLRMSVLIDNVLDFARGRLGGGINLNRALVPLEPVLRQVVDELGAAMLEREIDVEIDLPLPVDCDPARIGQLLSNLLSNAFAHGDPATPVVVKAVADGTMLAIAVANRGTPILPATMTRLFQPFFRGEVRPSQQGLGLGLHIAAEIARAHGGDITVSSTPAETRFIFSMPLAAG